MSPISAKLSLPWFNKKDLKLHVTLTKNIETIITYTNIHEQKKEFYYTIITNVYSPRTPFISWSHGFKLQSVIIIVIAIEITL